MIALLKSAKARPCHSPSSEGEGELRIGLVGRAYSRAAVPQGQPKLARYFNAGTSSLSSQVSMGRLNFCPLSPFPSLHQDRPIKAFQAVPRHSKHLSGLGSREKNLSRQSGTKVAQRPSERVRASQFQAFFRKKRIVYFSAPSNRPLSDSTFYSVVALRTCPREAPQINFALLQINP